MKNVFLILNLIIVLSHFFFLYQASVPIVSSNQKQRNIEDCFLMTAFPADLPALLASVVIPLVELLQNDCGDYAFLGPLTSVNMPAHLALPRSGPQ